MARLESFSGERRAAFWVPGPPSLLPSSPLSALPSCTPTYPTPTFAAGEGHLHPLSGTGARRGQALIVLFQWGQEAGSAMGLWSC